MKKKVLSVLLAAAMAMSMLTGCGRQPARKDGARDIRSDPDPRKQRQQQKRLLPQKTRH